MATAHHTKWKVCLVGSAAVGKTSLIRRYVVDEFDDRYLTTLGTKVSKKSIQLSLPGVDGPTVVDLAIWDIMGQPAFADLLRESYFSGAHGVLAIADMTRRSTLDDIDFWLRKVQGIAGRVPVVLAVNKADLVEKASFGVPEMERAAALFGCSYFLTSAKTGQHVEDLFRALAEAIAHERLSRPAVH